MIDVTVSLDSDIGLCSFKFCHSSLKFMYKPSWFKWRVRFPLTEPLRFCASGIMTEREFSWFNDTVYMQRMAWLEQWRLRRIAEATQKIHDEYLASVQTLQAQFKLPAPLVCKWLAMLRDYSTHALEGFCRDCVEEWPDAAITKAAIKTLADLKARCLPKALVGLHACKNMLAQGLKEGLLIQKALHGQEQDQEQWTAGLKEGLQKAS